MKAVDLHVHSTRSDGTYTPSELVSYAVQKELRAFALTDHDTIAGIEEAMLASKSQPVEVIPGIEFSTEYMGRDIHIVGLYIPYTDPAFVNRLKDFQDSRILRNQKMCKALQDHGIDITYEKLIATYPDAVITRAHYADYLYRHGYVKSTVEAFERYIGDHAPCFIPREKITPVEAVQFLRSHGAIPILAHPVLYGMNRKALETLVEQLTNAGLIGIEAIYSTYTPSDERDIRAIAKKYSLCISGGSDFHGANIKDIDLATGRGHLFVPEEVLDKLILRNSGDSADTKLLFSDMDGTLLTTDKTLSDSTRFAIDRMIKKGHKLILSSGRPLCNMIATKEALGLDYPGMYMIAFNGAVVYDCDKKEIIFSKPVPEELVQKLFLKAEQFKVQANTYYGDYVMAKGPSAELDFYLKRLNLRPYYSEGLLELKETPPAKVLVISLDNEPGLHALKEYAEKHYSKELVAEFSASFLLEFYHPQAGKGNALRFLANHLHVPLANTYAIGDQENDISMIQAAGTGIAMKNATPKVQEAASEITKYDNDHDGVAGIIEKYLN